MRRFVVILSLILATAACQSGPRPGVTSTPGQGAIAIQVVPNPIVAQQVSGNTYDFPFDLLIREIGGRPISVTAVTATVYGPGGIQITSESWDADRIRRMGYDVSIGARDDVRYRFSPRQSVPDERLFSSVSAGLRVDAVDDTGSPASASIVVTVTR